MIRHFTASGIVLSHDEQVLLIQHRKLEEVTGCAWMPLADVAGLDEVKKRLEAAFLASIACEPLERKLRQALRQGVLEPRAGVDAAQLAREQGVFSADEHAQWQRKESLRKGVIRVDDFAQDFDRAEIVHRLEREQSAAAVSRAAA